MPIRLSGLNSGLDTDAIVKALVSGYSYKKDTLTKKQTKLEWSQDAWKSLNTKVYSFYSGISNMRYSSAYNLKKTTVSDSTKASVTTSNSAVNGTQKLNILQVAQAGYMTGGKLASGTKGSTTMAELGFTGDDAQINVDKGDGTSKTITVKSSDTVDSVINQLKKAGLNASLDTTNGRMFVSSKESGVSNDFNLIAANGDGFNALSALGLNTSLTTKDANGNTVDSATATAYKKYGTFAMTEDGGVITDAQTIRDNITDAVTTYKNASTQAKNATAQIENLKSAAGSYATAYAAMKDSYAQYSSVLNESDNVLTDLAALASGSRGNTLVGEDGNFYSKTNGADTNGNTIYAYKDEDNNTHFVSKVSTYEDEEGKTYTKQKDGTYKSVDGDETYKGDTAKLTEKVSYYEANERLSATIKTKDDDGNEIEKTYDIKTRQIEKEDGSSATEYYFTTDDGEEYVSDSAAGAYTYTPEDGEKKTANGGYSYEKTDAKLTGMKEAADVYQGYVDNLSSTYGLSEADAKKALDEFSKNLTTVKNFEKQVTEDEGDYDATKQQLMTEVHNTYSNGESIDELVKDYYKKVATLTKELESANETMSQNSSVADLAALEEGSDKYNAAMDKMVSAASEAAGILTTANYESAAVKVDGKDAIIKLNDVTYTDASNSLTVNGLTVNAMAVTGDGDENAITITTATDTQGIYDKIKDFLTEYNSIINEMSKLYNADSAKGYEPLTDDEKDAMSDKEVEKWEAKIKDSLLRNDQTLNGVMTAMTSAMSQAVEINGKKYSLSSFGINTLGLLNSAKNEQYAYHIDGDEDDENTSGRKDKLMAAISEDPDALMDFFQKLSSNLYTALGDKMKSSSMSSVYTIYNDKQMDKQLTQYKQTIKDWENRITTKEDYYYNKFSKMESALSKLNSTQSSLSGYFGQ